MKHHYLLKFSKLIRKPWFMGLLCVVFSLQGYQATAQSLNISVTNEPLQEVFNIIARQSSYNFVYGDDYLDGTENVTLQMYNVSLTEVLDACLRGTGLWYRIEDRKIIIVSPKFEEPKRPAKPRQVSGHVFDENNNPMAGVSVVIKDTNRGTITGVDGSFSFQIPGEGAILRFVFLGMDPQEVHVVNQDNLSIIMQLSVTNIDDIVVTAYGVIQKREDLVGSATQIRGEDLKTLPVTRVDRMLEGLVPGFEINAQSDVASGRDRFSVRIRGEGSLRAGGEPLWIIDGVRMYTGNNTNAMPGNDHAISPLSLINPKDIESITVLKDATQTSIYGADGSNGIVLVTTKKGTKGKPVVNASVNYGLSIDDKSTRAKMLNGSQYLELAKEAWLNSGKNAESFPWQDNEWNRYSTTDTDWYDEYLDMGRRLQADISLRSGNEWMSSYVSVSYYDENPMVKGNRTQRLAARVNTDVDITDKLKFTLNLGVTHASNKIFGVRNSFYATPPIFSPYYDGTKEYRLINAATTIFRGGEINPYTGEEIPAGQEVYYPMQYRFANTLAEIDQNDITNRTLTVFGMGSISYEIIRGLRASAEFGVHYLSGHDSFYYARTNWSGADWDRVDVSVDPTKPVEFIPVGEARSNQSNNMNWSNVERLTFNRKFGKHSVGALAALEMRHSEQRLLGSYGYGYPNDKMKDVSYSDPSTRNGSGSTKLGRQLSYLGQITYNFDSRYYFTANYRRDGSSIFGEYSQWAPFFAFGGSWNIHNEPFFKVPEIDMLKIKVSYGVAGNSRIDGLISTGSYSISQGSGYRNNLGGTMGDAPNKDLSWENVFTTNLGFDLGLLGGAFHIGIEWYNRKTDNLIDELPVTNVTGTRTINQNIGIMRNRGFEAMITTRNIATPDFTWKTTFTLSHNKNKIVELYEGAYTSYFDHGYYVGYEKNAWNNIRWAGVDPRDGAPMWYDKNGNVTRTYNYDNRVLADYSRYPTVYGALTNTWVWRNFEFYMQINYSIGGWGKSSVLNDINDGKNMSAFDVFSNRNQPVEILDRWKTPGQLTTVPVLMDGATRYGAIYNDRTMLNKTYFQLSNVSFLYNLPSIFCEKINLNNVRVSFTVDNLSFLTPDQSRIRNSYKTAAFAYPQERIFTLGLEFGF